MWVIRSWFEQIACKKLVNRSKNSYFFICFWQCSPLLCPLANRSLRSSLIYSFLKSDLRDWLHRNREWFAQVAHDKRATGVIHSFFISEVLFLWANRSCAYSLFRSQKTSKSLEKPMSEFPTLVINKVPKVINTSSSILVYVCSTRK